jgi:hypothetical protein
MKLPLRLKSRIREVRTVKIYILEDNEFSATTFHELETIEYGSHELFFVSSISEAIHDIYISEEHSPNNTDVYIFDVQIGDSNGLPEKYLEEIGKGKKCSGYALMEYLRDELNIDLSKKIIFCTGYAKRLMEQIGEKTFSNLKVVNKSSIDSLSELRVYLQEIKEQN